METTRLSTVQAQIEDWGADARRHWPESDATP